MRRLRLYGSIWAIGFVFASAYAQEDVLVSEYEVKAAFLYNFAKFVEWPTSAVRDTTSPFVIGVLGRDPFGAILDQVIGSKSIKGKRLVIRRFSDWTGLSFCHLLFVSSSERTNLSLILEKLSRSCTLTVAEMEGFTENRGMVQFVMRDNRIHFMINAVAADEAGLKLSSKLLNLAVGVKKKSGNGGGI
ncbi:MAG TPA: YfiR family protein [bacterium]